MQNGVPQITVTGNFFVGVPEAYVDDVCGLLEGVRVLIMGLASQRG